MNRLSEFFKDKDGDKDGAFYPTNYIIAVFATHAEAERVKKDLAQATPSSIAATGEEMLEFTEDHAAKTGFWGSAMREVSRMIGTEATIADVDLKEAQKGAAFVAAYCSDDQAKSNIWGLLKQAKPLAARYYTSSGIEHLAGEVPN